MKVMGCLPIRPLSIFFLLSGFSLNVLAAEPPAAVPQPTTLDEAAAQRKAADRMREAAEARFAEEEAACYKKFLVNSCLEDAKKRYTQSLIEARNLDIPARDFQRDAKRTEADAKEAKRAADMPQREVDQRAQAARERLAEEIVAVPLESDEYMELGYIQPQNTPLSAMSQRYLELLEAYVAAYRGEA